MAFIPTPNVARCAVVGHIGNQQVVNTLWYQKGSPFDSAAVDDIVDRLQYWWASEILPLCANVYVVDEYVAWAQDSDTAPSAYLAASGTTAGLGTPASYLPASIACCVTHYTANRGRTSRGRTYVPVQDPGYLVDRQHFTTTLRTNLENAFDAIRAGMASLGYGQVVVSHYHNKVARLAGYPQLVTEHTANARIDTQRRRLGKL